MARGAVPLAALAACQTPGARGAPGPNAARLEGLSA